MCFERFSGMGKYSEKNYTKSYLYYGLYFLKIYNIFLNERNYQSKKTKKAKLKGERNYFCLFSLFHH